MRTMPAGDQDLFRRLNALKPTSFALEQRLHPVQPSPEAESHEHIDDLAARFSKLGGHKSQNQILNLDIDAEETEHNVENDRALDKLVQEVGDNSEWRVGPSDEEQARSLLHEAKQALHESDGARTQSVREENEDHQAEHQSTSEQREAEDYVHNALAEVEAEKTAPHSEKSSQSESTSSDKEREPEKMLDLPAAPVDLPQTHSNPAPSSLILPSAPTGQPQKQSPPHASPEFGDEEIETWCIICNDDATLRCLGCDGDLYCGYCWWEGHKSDDAQYEYTMHKALRFERGKRPIAKSRRVKFAAS